MSRPVRQPQGAKSTESRSPNPRRERPVKGMGANVSSAMAIPDTVMAVRPSLYKMATGRYAATEVIRDRFMNARPAVWLPFVSTFGPVFAGTQYFDPGTSPDTLVSTVAPFFKTMYGNIARRVAAVKKIAMRDTILDNSGTITDSWGYWISVYATAYTTLRALQGCLSLNSANLVEAQLANSVYSNWPALDGALNLLRSFAVPPMYIRFLDRMCGPIQNSRDNPLILAGVYAGTDLTVSGNVASLITAMVNELLILGNGNAALAAADAQRISNTHMLAYGLPQIPKEKPIITSDTVYAMHLFQAASGHDTTANTTTSFPNRNVTTMANVVPIVVPKGAPDDEETLQLFSLWRTPVWSADPLAGIASPNLASQVGWYSNQAAAAAGSEMGYYTQAGVYANRTNSGAGANNLTYASPEMEMLPWEAEAGAKATDYTADTRTWNDYNRAYTTVFEIIDESTFILEEMFLNSISLG